MLDIYRTHLFWHIVFVSEGVHTLDFCSSFYECYMYKNVQEIKYGYYYFLFLLIVIVVFDTHKNNHDVHQCTWYTTSEQLNSFDFI